MRVIGRVVRSLSLGMVALLGVGTLTATAAPPAPPSVATGNEWEVKPVAGGYQLTLRLDEPAPMRASLPLLAVDGVPLGVAKQSPDRRTLTLVSTDPAVLKAGDVRLIWSGDLGKEAGKNRSEAMGPTDADWLKARRGPLLTSDPGALGKYSVETSEYNLGDEAVYLPGLGQRSEIRGKVYTPKGAIGPRPLVIFLHGRHEFCYSDDAEPSDKPWPCPKGSKPVPSFRGYDGPATALAGNGYQVVSISANAVNAYDGDVYDSGAQARAELVLDHLALWKKWSTIGGGPFGRKFIGKIDLQNVGLMGHSRGGEGVARAAVLNADRGGQYGIRAVLPLAPTDFARATVPGVAMSVVLPYCDGDVSDLQGQKLYDDTRYSVTGDAAPRSTVTVLGANHNFFNTEWTPGQSEAPSNDDWFEEGKEAPCGAKYAGRLTAKEQQAVGTAYVAGFFRLQLGREKQFLPLLDGSDSRAASAGRAVVRVVSQAPAVSRRDVNHLDQPLPAGSVTGNVTAHVCAGVSQPSGPAVRAAAAETCMTTDDWANAPHWVSAWYAAKTPTTAVTKLMWSGTNGVVRLNVPAGQRDVRRFAALSFRAAPDPVGSPKTDLSVRVVDGHGRAAVVPVSAVSDALVRMPGSSENGLPKNLLRTVRIPVASLKGVDLRDVRAVELRTDKVARGSAYVSDLAFSSPGLGFSAPAALLPKLSASNVTVKEGDTGTKSMDFSVTMSRPSVRPVSVYVETNGELGETVGEVARKLVFKPGQVRQKVSVPVTSNTRDSYDLPFSLVLSAPRDGLLDSSFGHGLVIDDDPTPTLTIGNLTAAEKAGMVNIPVKLSAPSDRYVTLSGVLTDGTAVIRKDYASVNDDGTGPVDRAIDGFVEPGRTTGELTVKILDDKLKEPAETFSAVIQTAEGADIKLPVTATVTINAND